VSKCSLFNHQKTNYVSKHQMKLVKVTDFWDMTPCTLTDGFEPAASIFEAEVIGKSTSVACISIRLVAGHKIVYLLLQWIGNCVIEVMVFKKFVFIGIEYSTWTKFPCLNRFYAQFPVEISTGFVLQ
jgi:hypothetical protein